MVRQKHRERIFGEYTLKQKLGVGGMATVYYAIHNKLQREVAIKIIHEHFADDRNAVKRLEREAHIAQKLKHPNIVPIITFNTVNNRPYLVMPYYSGKTLADYFYHPRAVTHDVTLKILSKLAGALDYAHSKGVVHRDFKLENILLSKKNEPAISDFGIAQVANSTRLTATGNFLGTPQYMAPEQASSGYDMIDYRADLYAFGVMAYLMLTGIYPFTAADPIQLIMKHTTQAVPPPTLVNTELPSAVDSVLIRSLAKSPEYRYPSAFDFVASLDIALKNIPPITTLIDMEKLNVADFSHPSETKPDNTALDYSEIATRNFDAEPHAASAFADGDIQETRIFSDEEAIVEASDDQRKKAVFFKRLPVLSFLALLIVFAGITFAVFITSSNNNPVQAFISGDAESTEDIVDNASIGDNIEEAIVADLPLTDNVIEDTSDIPTLTAFASNTSRASSTANATNTRRPSSTPRPTNTASPTKTPTLTPTIRPSNTPRPLPTNTPVPVQPTSVPVQPTSVPVQPTNPPSNNNNNPVQPIVEEVVAPVVEEVVAPIVEEVGCLLLIGC